MRRKTRSLSHLSLPLSAMCEHRKKAAIYKPKGSGKEELSDTVVRMLFSIVSQWTLTAASCYSDGPRTHGGH